MTMGYISFPNPFNTMKVLSLVVLFVAAVSARTPTGTLEGFQVLSVTAVTPKQYEFLRTLVENVELDFWTEPKYQGVTDIMVSPDQKELFVNLLATNGIKWSVKIQNVGKIVDQQKADNDKALRAGDGRMSWDAYQRYPAIVAWLNSIASNELVTLTVIGKSFEGRDIHQVKISTGDLPNGGLKRAIFIDAHFHAREWVSGASATWIINEIISNPSKYTEILSLFDFFIVPLANPDGYEFSHGNGERMWRKTRSTNPGSSCYGTDPNRNFAYYFGGESTSSQPCSDIFKGESAFSEVETAAVRDAIWALQGERTVFAYYTIHSYSQLWLLNWGYTAGAYPADYDQLLSWGRDSVAAIRSVHQKTYRAGQGADILYGVGGASDDWAKSEGIKYVTTLEVRDTGAYGFLLPADQIIPTSEEIWAGIQVIVSRA